MDDAQMCADVFVFTQEKGQEGEQEHHFFFPLHGYTDGKRDSAYRKGENAIKRFVEVQYIAFHYTVTDAATRFYWDDEAIERAAQPKERAYNDCNW